MELSLCFENQMVLKLPSSVMEKLRSKKPGDKIGMLKYDQEGKREWELLDSKFSETKTSNTETDIVNQNERSGYLFVNNSNKPDKISMYPSKIHTLVRKGGFVTDDIRRRIQEKTKKSSTIEDTKRIVGSIYEAHSQPFLYYDYKAEQMTDEQRTSTYISNNKRKSNLSNNQQYNSNEAYTSTNDNSLNMSSNSLENLKENIFKIFEEKGSEGVSLKEIENRTMKPKHIVKKIVEEIALQAGRGGRRHIWFLKPQYMSK